MPDSLHTVESTPTQVNTAANTADETKGQWPDVEKAAAHAETATHEKHHGHHHEKASTKPHQPPTYTSGEGAVPMRTLTRALSTPPAVGLFGGVSPTGQDAEEGLAPARSREEEVERELEREAKGFDPYAVKFEPGEKINPKVSVMRGRSCPPGCA